MTDIVENRWAAFLNPIRDLAENWNIDIASELEEYLDELENLTFAFEGHSQKLNFSEAALLIQGSACVYSKKVEYLYGLVYQTLDLLFMRKKATISGKIEDELLEDNEPAFLLLDDIPESNNIDLVEDEPVQRLSHTAPMVGGDFMMNSWHLDANGALLHDVSFTLEGKVRYDTFEEADRPGFKNLEPNQQAIDNGDQDFGGDGGAFDDDFESNYQAGGAEEQWDRVVAHERPQPNLVLSNSKTAGATTTAVHLRQTSIWEELDPHAETKAVPFKRGNTARAPRQKNHKPVSEFAYLRRRFKKPPPANEEQWEWQEMEQALEGVEIEEPEPLPYLGDPVAFRDDDEDFGGYGGAFDDDDGFGVGGVGEHNESGVFGTTYEELCRQHIDKYLAQTQEQFRNDTALTRRVAKWQERIVPLLAEQESRPEFDLFKKKDAILDSLRVYVRKNKENRKGLLPSTAAIGAENKWEVARNFASMLQLINSGSLELLHQDAFDFSVRLLVNSK